MKWRMNRTKLKLRVTTASRVFTDLLSNSPKCSPRFSPGYEGTENMFYFLNRINILSLYDDMHMMAAVHLVYKASKN